MTGIRSICVYCGSATGSDPSYVRLASRLGEAIAKRGYRLVYGGGTIGLMYAAARAAHETGGEVLGVIPKFLERVEGNYEAVPHRIVDTMHERKKILFDEADAFVVLPGGIGTLEEAVETLSWAKLSLHAKPMAFLSENDYWAPFFELMRHFVKDEFAPKSMLDLVVATSSPDKTLDELDNRFIALD